MRAWKWIAGGVGALLLAVAGAAWVQATTIAERSIRAALAQYGIPVQSLTLTTLRPHRLAARAIALGEEGALRIGKLHARFDYDWRARRMGAVTVTLEDMEIHARLGQGKMLLGGIERLWEGAALPPDPAATDLRLAGALTLHRAADGTFSGQWREGRVTLGRRQEMLLLPLVATADMQGDAQSLRFSGAFASRGGDFSGNFAGDYAPQAGRGTITWETQPVDFSHTGFTLARLSPASAEGWDAITGRLSLRGTVSFLPEQWVLAPVVTIHALAVAPLLEPALGEGTQVRGSIEGVVPVRITKNGNWRFAPSRLVNSGPMEIRVHPQGKTGVMLAGHPQAALVQAALSNLRVETLTLDLKSTDAHGGLQLIWHFLGRNPDLQGGKPVDLTLAVTLNLRDMWRSVEEVKRATDAARKQRPRGK